MDEKAHPVDAATIMPKVQADAILPPSQHACRETAYIARRLDPQIEWYEAKSATAKSRHFGFSGAQIIATGMIPVANLLPGGAISSTALAAIAGVSAALAALGGYHAHWRRYRAAAAALQKVKVQHELGLPPYDDEDADRRLVRDVEALLSGEQEDWEEAMVKQTAAKAPGTRPRAQA